MISGWCRVFEQQTDPRTVAAGLARPIEWVETGVIPKAQLCNIQYEDLIYDPIATVKQVYEFYGLTLSGAAEQEIVKYMQAHPRDVRPAHKYALGEDKEIAEERKALKRYQDYFSVPNEN